MRMFLDRLRQEGLISARIEKNGKTWTLAGGVSRRAGSSEALARVKSELLKETALSRRTLLIALGVVVVIALSIMIIDPNIARFYRISPRPAGSDAPGATGQDRAILSDAALSSLSPEALQAELFRSVTQQNGPRVEAILNLGGNMDGTDNRGDTPLLAALKTGDADMAGLLLDHGAGAAVANSNGVTPLMRAASFGFTGIMDRLVAAGADVTTVDRSGRSALHHAIRGGSLGAVRKLLRWKLDPNRADQAGATPLLLAVQGHQDDIVSVLLKAGADPDRGAPLVAAAAAGREQVVRALIASGADLNGMDAKGTSALQAAASAVQVPVVRTLLSSARESSGSLKGTQAVLMQAIDSGKNAVAMELVSAGIRLPLPPLPMDVANRNRWAAYRTLLRTVLGEVASRDRDTALLDAVREGDVDAVRLALEKGADPDAADADGATGVLLAVERNRLPMLELLLGCGAGPEGREHVKGRTPLTVSATVPDPRPARALLDAGAAPNRPDADGYTALDLAFARGNRLVIPVLVAGGCRAVTENNINQWTPLAFVIAAGKTDMMGLLLRSSRDLDREDSNGWTALGYAILMDNGTVLRRLIAAGADVNARDKLEWNPLHLAVLTGNPELVRQLLAARAKVNRRTAVNVSPLHLAAALGRGELVKMLLKAGARDRYRADADLVLGDRRIRKGEKALDTIRRLANTYRDEPVYGELVKQLSGR